MKNLWQPPRLRQPSPHERRATWLELFFDLVFVATIAELGKVLSDDVSVQGLLHYVALFIPVWWCWVGETFYATRFDQDSLNDRLVTLLQMMILVVMAVNAHHGLDTSSVGFALSYATFRIILILQYAAAGWFNPEMRSMIRHFCSGFGLSVLFWIISVFVPAPLRFGLWAIGLSMDFLTPFLGSRFVIKFPPDMTHIPERMGLFTIVVLGESLFAAITGLSKQSSWDLNATAIAVLGLVTAFSLWWMYFETVDGTPLQNTKQGRVWVSLFWLYLHLPLTIGITAAGVGTKYATYKGLAGITLSDAGRWLLCGSMGSCLLTLAVLHWITCSLDRNRRRALIYHRLAGVGLLWVVAVLGSSLQAIAVAGIVALVGCAQIAIDVLQLPSLKSLE
ncbi:MAG: low temperature requirement protein A [Microcoleus sp.]